MPGAVANANAVNLNSASKEELDRIGGLGRERVERIVENRPFQNWDDLRNRVEGISDTLVNDLREAGAQLD